MCAAVQSHDIITAGRYITGHRALLTSVDFWGGVKKKKEGIARLHKKNKLQFMTVLLL